MDGLSKGHVCFVRPPYGSSPGYESELYHGPDGTLYRAPKDYPIDVYGYRQGGRFECMPRDDNHEKFIADSYRSIGYTVKSKGNGDD